MKKYIPVIATMIASLLEVTSGLAWAQSAPCDHPLSVSPERERTAAELTDRAFAQHIELNYEQAAALYLEALGQWDRPDIHRQIGIAYFYAARTLEAHHHLSVALRCGREWMEPQDYLEALDYMTRLRRQVGELEVRVQASGARVLVDDELWFEGPGTRTRALLAGRHVLVVEKARHVTVQTPVFVAPGERTVAEPVLLTKAQATVVSRRWRPWMPWAVVGAGVLLGATGGLLDRQARSGFAAFERDLLELCGGPGGCGAEDQAAVRAQRSAATWNQRLAVGSFIVSGVTLATATALVVLNRPRTSEHPDAGRAGLRVVPMVSPDGAGVSLGMSF